jgi:hypothetical protein
MIAFRSLFVFWKIMLETQIETPPSSDSRFKRWLLQGVREPEGPYEKEQTQHHTHPWWKVMCLTGVDYFSTLGYQPGIAFLAAGALSPIATLILVLLTLFGALPMYNRVAAASPHGDGSISMLENLLSRWKGKLFVLALLGFAATSFIITITLSAADATAHILENPFVHEHLKFLEHPVPVTLVLIALLGAVFLKGFKEAVGIAVVIVIVYIALNLVVISTGFMEIARRPEVLTNWQSALFGDYTSPMAMIAAALFVFPKLALGLSGFETGVVVMPLVKGEPGDSEEKPIGRIHNTRKLLTAAALIMSVLLITSSIITTMLIPAAAFRPATDTEPAGEASGRALAYLAHNMLGDGFGTIYDISTILILWFAGSSAMAGLLNIVPRYLPRYGMAPDWARATRPLVLVFTLICFAVTILFKASVEAQGGAYATGVLALMTSAAIAVTLLVRRSGSVWWWAFLLISLIFVYTTVVNIVEQPEGLKIALIFIAFIVLASFVSRALRSTELRVESIELDALANEFIDNLKKGEVRLVTNRRETGDVEEYRFKEHEKRLDNHIPSGDPILFYEVELGDASEFSGKLQIQAVDVDGYKILRTKSPAVPNAIAAFLMYLRDRTGKIPHVYFGWSEGNPAMYLFRYILFGEGDTAPVTREILRQAEPDPERRPNVHVGG